MRKSDILHMRIDPILHEAAREEANARRPRISKPAFIEEAIYKALSKKQRAKVDARMHERLKEEIARRGPRFD